MSSFKYRIIYCTQMPYFWAIDHKRRAEETFLRIKSILICFLNIKVWKMSWVSIQKDYYIPGGVWKPGDDSLKQHEEKSLPASQVVCQVEFTQWIFPILDCAHLKVYHPSPSALGKPTILCVLYWVISHSKWTALKDTNTAMYKIGTELMKWSISIRFIDRYCSESSLTVIFEINLNFWPRVPIFMILSGNVFM